MQDKRGSLSVAALKDFHPEGNIIPMEWFTHLKFENGKPDMNAILILADILYWYRPVQVRDEETGVVVGYRKKFKNDLLQKSYHHYANLFGLSKRQVTDAIIRLEDRGLIQRVFRDIDVGVPLQNVLFIALDVEKVKQLQASVGGLPLRRDTPHDEKGHPSRFIVGGPRSIGGRIQRLLQILLQIFFFLLLVLLQEKSAERMRRKKSEIYALLLPPALMQG